MQEKVEHLRRILSEIFEKEARIDGSGVKLNVRSLNANDMFMLNRVSVNSKIPVEVKRSGTGLVIIFTC